MRRIALALGPLLFVTTIATGPFFGMTEAAWHVAGLASWMAVWWLSAVVPLEATALLPLVMLPLIGTRQLREVASSYADPVIFLFLGGFLLAATLERWELHRRFAVTAVRRVGTSAPKVLLAFMIVSALASMWISNTATAVMMLPIAVALVRGAGSGELEAVAVAPNAAPAGSPGPPHLGFPTALMLGIAYACSIGGVATLIGTPPNAILAGAARELIGVEITFAGWLLVGLSASIPMLAICWLWLVRFFKVSGEVPGLAAVVTREGRSFGRLAGGEKFVISVFAITALAWVFRAPKEIGNLRIPGLTDLLPSLSDPIIAIMAALVFFAVPLPKSRFTTALDWESARKVPWGILLLFGGGIALAGAFEVSGLSDWVGGRLAGLRGVPFPLIILATATIFVFLTELTSNTATAALGMPLMAGVAQGLGVAALPLMAAAALSASMAFMLPVATPPNAIVFGSGAIRSRDMAAAGVGLNLIAVVVISVVVWAWV
ncbi:MAG: DASS family sodium-coupled anion symporter [Gemmatimonadota bacterium]|nr:MAG: DASS family sodium-coupled anion symporter [Gemmatimonadota bacterium]